MSLIKKTYTVDLSDIPDDIIEWDEYIAWQEANNYSSYTLYIEDNLEKDSYEYKYGGFLNLEGEELLEKWKQVRQWFTDNGLPEDEKSILIEVFW